MKTMPLKSLFGHDTDCPDELEELLNEKFEEFIAGLQQDDRFVISVDKYDGPVDDHWQFVYTNRATKLVENMKRRLGRIFESRFPEEEFNIESYLYEEL